MNDFDFAAEMTRLEALSPLEDNLTKAAQIADDRRAQGLPEIRPEGAFDCEKCGGTGKYRGPRRYQEKTKCFACNGRGWFRTSYGDRMKARQKSAKAKADLKTANFESAMARDPQLICFLQSAAPKSDFAASLIESIEKYGSLSEKQLAAAQSMRAKWQANDQRRAAERAELAQPAAKVDFSRIMEAMSKAREAGIKTPIVRLEAGKLSLAPLSGKNPGCIYFKDGETYLGKITPQGDFMRSRDCTDASISALVAAAADPLAAMVAYGRRTGTCSCCGRELTNKLSIELGIGPICRARFGLA